MFVLRFFLSTFVPFVTGDVIVTGNAGDGMCSAESGCLSNWHLEESNVISNPLIVLQGTTIREVKPIKIKSRKNLSSFYAPMYRFIQSPDLVEDPIEFKLLLLKDINSNSVFEVATDEFSSADSWYPGYKWSILLCLQNGNVQHIGWRFRSATSMFNAVIVENLDEDNGLKVKSGKIREGQGIKNKSGNIDKDYLNFPTLSDLEIAPRPAEAWMVSLLMAGMKMGKGSV